MNQFPNFEGVVFFKPTDLINGQNAWGNPLKISREHILKLDALRKYIGKPITLTSPAWTPGSGHSNDSQHYLGTATDIRCKGLSYMDFYIACERFEFGGIGLYDTGFIHTDSRPIPKNQPGARWIRKNGVYVPFERVNFLVVCDLSDKCLATI